MGERGLSLRPRLGVLLVTSGWFRDVGLQSADGGTSAAVDQVGRALVERLGRACDVTCAGVVYSPAEARRAAEAIRAADVDGLLLVPLMWCEDAIPRAALSLLPDLPLVLWTFSPAARLPGFVPFQRMIQGSGPVCTMQLSGMLRREGRAFRCVVGHADDGETLAEIEALAAGMAVRRLLSRLRVGVLPFPCSQMSSTYVDEFGLRAVHGTELRYLELERVRRAAAAATGVDIAGMRAGIADAGMRVEVNEQNLVEGIRYALALEKVMAEEGLAALAMNDVIEEVHASFGLRPCLWNPRLSAGGAVIAMEADVAAACAMAVLRAATGASPFYTEPFSIDHEAGAILMGHAGYHDGSNADPAVQVAVVNDVEYENSDRFTGAATLFKYGPGPVTAVNCTWNGTRLKWVLAEGESLPGPARMDGNCHLVFRPDAPVKRMVSTAVESGISQHWLFVPGRRAGLLALACSVAGLDALVVEPAGAGAPRGVSGA
jgi:L-arabinose isomerase